MKITVYGVQGPIVLTKPSIILSEVPINAMNHAEKSDLADYAIKNSKYSAFDDDSNTDDASFVRITKPLKAIRSEWDNTKTTLNYFRQEIMNNAEPIKEIKSRDELEDIFVDGMNDFIQYNYLFRVSPRTYAIIDTTRWKQFKEGMKERPIYDEHGVFMGYVKADRVVVLNMHLKKVPLVRFSKEFVKEISREMKMYARFHQAPKV